MLAVALAAGCDAAPTPRAGAPSAPERSPAPEGCVRGVASLPARMHAGVSVAHNYQRRGARGYGTETSRATLQELHALGVRWVSLTPFGFMRSLDESEVHLAIARPEAENDARMEAEIRAAHALGLRVFLKPHVWIAGGAWRGELAPDDWDAWFESYRAFTLHYARMAARLDVALLSIGVELPTSGPREAQWRALIAAVREVYDGALTFAANWDRVDEVAFWPALDHVGVQLYPPLAPRLGADEATMRAALDRRLDGLEAIAARAGRSLLITEVGYKSIEGTEVHPHEWPERLGRPAVSEAAQASAYRRLFASISGRERVAGLYVWKWFTDPDTDEEGPHGFSPRDKLAEAVLRSAYHPRCR